MLISVNLAGNTKLFKANLLNIIGELMEPLEFMPLKKKGAEEPYIKGGSQDESAWRPEICYMGSREEG